MIPLLVQPISNEESTNILPVPWIRFLRYRFHGIDRLAANPNPQWTEYEMQSIDEWIARQDVKLDRPEAIRHLVELGLKVKTK